jgi:hypothetical protein
MGLCRCVGWNVDGYAKRAMHDSDPWRGARHNSWVTRITAPLANGNDNLCAAAVHAQSGNPDKVCVASTPLTRAMAATSFNQSEHAEKLLGPVAPTFGLQTI